jgi:zinc ribbon protein
MTARTSYCASCGSPLESDSEFCTSCGAAKRTVSHAPPAASAPHAWMNDASPAARPAHVAATVQPVAQVQQPQYIHSPQGTNAQDDGLPRTVRTMGIVAISLMAIGLIPCLGWLNYLNFTFSFVTLVLSIVALTQARSDAARSSALIGLTLVILADFVGVFRLAMGGGCL